MNLLFKPFVDPLGLKNQVVLCLNILLYIGLHWILLQQLCLHLVIKPFSLSFRQPRLVKMLIYPN
jgi:hypothetical protein